MMLEVLRRYVRQPLVFNQLQFSLDQSQLIDQALYVNNLTTERSIDRDNGTLDYCRLHDITVQAWSPLQRGFFKGCFVGDPELPELNRVLGELGEQYGDRDRVDPPSPGQDTGDRRDDESDPPAGYLRGVKGRAYSQRMVPALPRLRQVPSVKDKLM